MMENDSRTVLEGDSDPGPPLDNSHPPSDSPGPPLDNSDPPLNNPGPALNNSTDPVFVVVVAGLPRSGKSRVLNNLFGLDFESRLSRPDESVTLDSNSFKIEKRSRKFIIIDTPGLGAKDISISKVRRKFYSVVGDLNYTLLYCHSVSPTARETDEKVLKVLQDTLGKNIWKNCVLLLTFSDNLRQSEIDDRKRPNDPDKYQDYLRGRVQHFSSIFQKQCGRKVPEVKLVLDDDDNSDGKIVAVPVGRHVNDLQVIPVKDGQQYNWKDLALLAIFKKSTALQLMVFRDPKKQAMLGIGAGALAGAGLGALTGGVVGGAIGGVGAIPGVGLGALVGAITGVLSTGGMGGGMLSYVEANKNEIKDKVEKLLTSEFVDTSAAEAECSPAISVPQAAGSSRTEEAPVHSSSHPGATGPSARGGAAVPIEVPPRPLPNIGEFNGGFIERTGSQILVTAEVPPSSHGATVPMNVPPRPLPNISEPTIYSDSLDSTGSLIIIPSEIPPSVEDTQN